MERLAFIHGSSVGQSVFIPKNPASICSDIADKYFKGRTLRQKESAAKLALFVDLYKANNEKYCVYSFVNNECFGANGREGQYFAITILCKEVFVYPEVIYQMFQSAYLQMIDQKHIIHVNQDGKEQYVISQFNEAQDYLTKFLDLVEKGFDSITGGAGKPLPEKIQVADYDAWRGFQVNTENCNSINTYNQLCAIGRLYIADEYETNKTKLVNLLKKVTELETTNKALKQEQAQANQKKDATIKAEIDSLKSQINAKDIEIQKLSDENSAYNASIEAVRKEMEKYAKAGKKIVSVQENVKKSQNKGKKELLNISLLFVIFILILLSSLMNYLFFRNLSLDSKPKAEKSEMTTHDARQEKTENIDNKPIAAFEINPVHIEADASGFSGTITVTSGNSWECPTSNLNWVILQKVNDTTLGINVLPQQAAGERNATFMVKSGDNEKQISIHQKGNVISSTPSVTYNITIKDSKGNTLQKGATVHSGEVLTATIGNPTMGNGFGWAYDNCAGKKENLREVKVTVGNDTRKDVVISYGELSNSSKRTKFNLKIAQTGAPKPETHIEPESDVTEKNETGTPDETTKEPTTEPTE